MLNKWSASCPPLLILADGKLDALDYYERRDESEGSRMVL